MLLKHNVVLTSIRRRSNVMDIRRQQRCVRTGGCWIRADFLLNNFIPKVSEKINNFELFD